MTDHEQPMGETPVEDFGGDSPTRRPAPAAAPPDRQAARPPGAGPVPTEVLENAPVEGYGGKEATTAHSGEPPG